MLLAEALQAAAARVYRQLGRGHREAVYQRALVCELRHAGLWVQEEVPVPITYRLDQGPTVVLATERADLVVAGSLVVELKVGSTLGAPLQAALQQVGRYWSHLPGVTEAAVIVFGGSGLEVRFLPRTATGSGG